MGSHMHMVVGISPQENVSYTPQQFNESVAKVRSVYRREMESHNLVIPIQWLTIKEVLGEGKLLTTQRPSQRLCHCKPQVNLGQ